MAKSEKKYTLDAIVKGIGKDEQTEWSGKKLDASANIRKSLLNKIALFNKEDVGKEEEDRSYNSQFVEYCSTIKALLTIYNFGEYDDVKNNNDDEDKEIIGSGIKKIIAHVKDKENYGFDLSPGIEISEYREIFNKNGKLVPVTSTAALVLTTLVYFRRAIRRRSLMSDEEWKREYYSDVTEIIADILMMFYDFAYTSGDEENNFRGWGVTLDKEFTRVVNLSDTFTVIEAISRFSDACLQVDEDKLDEEFVKGIDKIGQERNFKKLSASSEECTYKVGLNIYSAATGANVYGKSVFYVSEEGKRKGIVEYVPTTYDQISGSNRSSALFNPLYVATISMYGYTDKEVVIAKLQDDYELAKSLYKKYYLNYSGENSLFDYYLELRERDNKKFFSIREEANDNNTYMSDKDKFENQVKILIEKHDKVSKIVNSDNIKNEKKQQSDGNGISWRQYYNAARIFQKYIEKYHPDELLKIQEYKDYLNATKDAIDQVQVMYRDFDRNQRLGIVDTDYATFSQKEILLTKDSNVAIISKLNKANIAVNNLRPLLLSSKILIVNALTKYPSFDMVDLYDSIIDSQYKVRVKTDTETHMENVWLWNADGVNMRSTASHCDSIMYDYFDYYEKYELGFKTITALRKNINKYIGIKRKDDDSIGLDIGEDLSIKFNLGDETTISPFVKLVLEMTKINVDKIKDYYRNILADKNSEIVSLKDKNAQLGKDVMCAREEEKKKYEDILEYRSGTYKIGQTVLGWIEQGVEKYLHNTIAMTVVKAINRKIADNSEDLFNKCEKVYDADRELIARFWNEIKDEIKYEPSEEAKKQKIKEFANKIDYTYNDLRDIVELAFNGVLSNLYGTPKFDNVFKDYSKYDDINRQLGIIYGQNKDALFNNINMSDNNAKKVEENSAKEENK